MFSLRRARYFGGVLALSVGLLVAAFPGTAFAAYTCTGGGDHGGAAWDPATDCPGGIAGVHTNIGTMTIGTGETATVQAYNGTSFGSVSISATTITVTGTLTAAAKGYTGGTTGPCIGGNGTGGGIAGSGGGAGGGGGYGGIGGTWTAAGGAKYGSLTAPTDLGSGGGCGNTSYPGGNGGGAIRLTASGTLTVNGTVSANGGNGSNYGGGGSGGSIYLTAATFAGSGALTANGGTGTFSGSGGGGRIAIYYSSSNTFSGTNTANFGTGGASGVNGSDIIVNSSTSSLTVQNSQTWDANPSLEGSSFTYSSITVTNNATWKLNGYYTTSSNGYGTTFSVTNFTINSGSSVVATGGYAGGTSGSQNGVGPGGGTGAAGGGGAGYGGAGGSQIAGTAGSAYGSATAPVDLGSGGGYGTNGANNGGAGGGAVKIVASGTITISGSLTANGTNGVANYGGGGSGGSIYLIAATLAGAGTLTANGGNGTFSGAGAGGRVAIYYTTSNTWTGTTLDAAHAAVKGANGGTAASNGTVRVSLAYNALAQSRSITMSTSAPAATSVSYHVVFTPTIATTIGGIVVDICDNDPLFNDASCTYPSGFSWGGASPSLTVNGGMGTGWTAAGVQGGGGAGTAQVLELSNSTPQSVSTATPIDFTVSSVTNPTSANHSFFARVVTFTTAGNMTSEYTVSTTTRTGNLTDAVDHGGMALSTGTGIGISFRVPETLTFCVSASTISSNCTGTTAPNLTLGHGTPKVLTVSAVDTANAYTQLSTNANSGVVVRLHNIGAASSEVRTNGPSGTQYMQPIGIDNTSNGNTLTNYQFPVTINTASLISAGKMRSDCGDIRFRDADNATAISNYWVENCNNANTKIWVKVPSIPASSQKVIFLYYGAPSATSLSSTTNTFQDDIGNLVGAWRMTEGSGTTTADSSGNSNTATFVNSPTWTTGKFGNAISFVGTSSQYLSLGTTGLPSGNSNYALVAWIKPTTQATNGIIGWGTWGTTNRVNALRLNAGGMVHYWWGNDLTATSSNLANGSWHLVVGQFDGTTRRIYADNTAIGSDTPTGHNAVVSGPRIGSTNNGEFFNGAIGPVYVFTQALTTGQLADLYNGYGYATTNYAGHLLVRSYSSPEPVQTSGACGGLSLNGGSSCGIPAVNTSCSGSCSATAISAGTAAFGVCVLAGSANTAVIAPYNGASCGSGTNYGLDDATSTNVRGTYGSPIFSGAGPLNQESDTLTFAAAISGLTPAGTYTGAYSLIATGTF